MSSISGFKQPIQSAHRSLAVQPVSPTRKTGIADTVKFGSNEQSSQTADSKQWYEKIPGVKNIWAGLKGGFQGAFGGSWNDGLWGGCVLGLVTFPFALAIPGYHVLLIPGYMLAKRAWNGISGLLTGLSDPDKILHPSAEKA